MKLYIVLYPKINTNIMNSTLFGAEQLHSVFHAAGSAFNEQWDWTIPYIYRL